MIRVYLSLGSNIEPRRYLRAALDELRAEFGAIDVSPAYHFPAFGFDGPDFVNLAVGLDTDLAPEVLNAWLHALEDRHGRRRDVPRYSSRTLDIDIVLYGERIERGAGNFEVPRPELKHAFVLKPLAELAPDAREPRDGRTLADLWRAHPDHARHFERVTLDDRDARC